MGGDFRSEPTGGRTSLSADRQAREPRMAESMETGQSAQPLACSNYRSGDKYPDTEGNPSLCNAIPLGLNRRFGDKEALGTVPNLLIPPKKCSTAA